MFELHQTDLVSLVGQIHCFCSFREIPCHRDAVALVGLDGVTTSVDTGMCKLNKRSPQTASHVGLSYSICSPC